MKRAFSLLGILLFIVLGSGCDFQSSASGMYPSSDSNQKDSMTHLPLKALNAFHQAIRVHKTHDEYSLLGANTIKIFCSDDGLLKQKCPKSIAIIQKPPTTSLGYNQ